MNIYLFLTIRQSKIYNQLVERFKYNTYLALQDRLTNPL